MIRARMPTVVATALVAWVVACGDGGTGTSPEPPNRAPLAVGAVPHQTVHVGDSAILDLATYFTDPDGDSLFYAATTSNEEVAAASTEGSVVLVAAVSQGSATVAATATDPGGLSATQVFKVTVPNREPLIVDTVPGLELVEGDSAFLEVTPYFADPDGDSLSYTVESSREEIATVDLEGSRATVTALDQGSATVAYTVPPSEKRVDIRVFADPIPTTYH